SETERLRASFSLLVYVCSQETHSDQLLMPMTARPVNNKKTAMLRPREVRKSDETELSAFLFTRAVS
ncbi:hypothetical protein, partial [Mixta calida]|uniref:hypothetical protein n=1 Tax=Mixta calida TaxID=665913 RepID=UPI0028AC3565